jgi:hypothetical protein
MTWKRIYVFPDGPIDKTVYELLREAEEDEEITSVFIGNCPKLWVVDLEKMAIYVLEKGNHKLLKLKEMEV